MITPLNTQPQPSPGGATMAMAMVWVWFWSVVCVLGEECWGVWLVGFCFQFKLPEVTWGLYYRPWKWCLMCWNWGMWHVPSHESCVWGQKAKVQVASVRRGKPGAVSWPQNLSETVPCVCFLPKHGLGTYIHPNSLYTLPQRLLSLAEPGYCARWTLGLSQYDSAVVMFWHLVSSI